MNKYNRRSRPNLRTVLEFWVPGTEPNEAGELIQVFTQKYRGPFALEVPQKPIEVSAQGLVQTEQQFTAVGQWCRLASTISEGMFCVCVAKQKVYAVVGQATDPWGDSKKIHIRLVDNVAQPISQKLLPTMI
jgi:hypothetical protein